MAFSAFPSHGSSATTAAPVAPMEADSGPPGTVSGSLSGAVRCTRMVWEAGSALTSP